MFVDIFESSSHYITQFASKWPPCSILESYDVYDVLSQINIPLLYIKTSHDYSLFSLFSVKFTEDV